MSLGDATERFLYSLVPFDTNPIDFDSTGGYEYEATYREVAGGAETVSASDVVDVVTVATSQYLVTDAATGAGTLSVTAASSDLFTPPVGSTATPAFLSVRRPELRPFPTITLGQFNVLQTIPGFAFPAPNLNIRSSKSGRYIGVLPVAGAATAP